MTVRAILLMLTVLVLASAGIGLLLGTMAGNDPLSLGSTLSEPFALVLAGLGMGAMMLRRCTLR